MSFRINLSIKNSRDGCFQLKKKKFKMLPTFFYILWFELSTIPKRSTRT